MPARLSAALRNYAASQGSYRHALQGGKIEIYSGSQPSTAEAAPTGTLLCTITDSSGAHTNEVLAVGTIELTGGASGSIDTVTVDGVSLIDAAVPFNSTLTQTAADLAAAINRNSSNPEYTATAASQTVTIRATRGAGASANGLVVASTTTTITKTDSNMSGGVNSANGLKFEIAAAGVLGKRSDQTWTGVAVATGTAGWFRFTGPVADSGALDSTESQIRLDGTISTSGQQLNFSSTSFVSGATQTVTSFNITLPTS